MPLAPGSTFGSYDILTLLGVGGMGEVYSARDRRLKRDVAVKVLPAALQGDADRLARFEREAQTASNLNHPNILTIFEIGDVDGTRFMAAELVAGETLRARLERGSMPVADAIDIATQIATGMSAAHQAGIVHRDLKPENVIVRPDGLVKVLDFGLAKPVESPLSGSLVETLAQTSAGTIAGTIAYMSPEQARGLPVDARTDVFSLGVMLYEMLCGAPPFQGPTATDVIVAILEHAPDGLVSRRPDIPPDLEAIVERCLQKDRSRRYGTARDLAEALRRVAAPPGVSATPDGDIPSVAVLPFANMSADPDNEYFCDGIAEEITGALGKIERLQVAGRTSAFSFKGKTGDLREIGRTLNVSTVLEGSVRRAGNRLRISAQLVNVSDGYRLWSERYDRQMEDIFDIQDEIALAVVEALKVTLLGEERAAVVKRGTDDAEAYNLCLKAYNAWSRWTDEGFRTAMALFEQARQRDPSYALAHFGLGDCQAAWGVLGREPIDLPRMRALMEGALRLDPELADAHAALGAIIEGVYGFDWTSAERRCQRALELDPRSAHVRNLYGILLGVLGRYDESVAMFKRCLELDPLNPFWNACYTQTLVGSRDWEAAFAQIRTTLELAPSYWFVLHLAGQAHASLGQWDRAIDALERAVSASSEAPFVLGLLGNALARAGNEKRALQQLADLRQRSASHHVPSLAFAYVHAGLGQLDETFAALETARQQHDAWLVYSLTVFPMLDDLRPDPRFTDMVRRIRL